MKAYLFSAVLSILLVVGCSTKNQSPPAHEQVVLVLNDFWSDPTGNLIFLEWQNSHWKVAQLGPVNLGRNGLAWGRGLYENAAQPKDPVKVEGDGKAPAGCFELIFAFGNALHKPANINLPWVQLGEMSECIDDTESDQYNLILTEPDHGIRPNDPKGQWYSSEMMLRPDSLYALGAFVGHNYHKTTAGAGSCIFLHIEKGPKQPTAGCTSMPRQFLQELLSGLETERSPILMQYNSARLKSAVEQALKSDAPDKFQQQLISMAQILGEILP